jgi:hypothetical protein
VRILTVAGWERISQAADALREAVATYLYCDWCREHDGGHMPDCEVGEMVSAVGSAVVGTADRVIRGGDDRIRTGE